MHYFIDIDGTLTDTPEKAWGHTRQVLLDKVRLLISLGHSVVLWSARGSDYANAFAVRYNLDVDMCLAKPDYIVDDIPTIRAQNRIGRMSPKEFERHEP